MTTGVKTAETGATELAKREAAARTSERAVGGLAKEAGAEDGSGAGERGEETGAIRIEERGGEEEGGGGAGGGKGTEKGGGWREGWKGERRSGMEDRRTGRAEEYTCRKEESGREKGTEESKPACRGKVSRREARKAK